MTNARPKPRITRLWPVFVLTLAALALAGWWLLRSRTTNTQTAPTNETATVARSAFRVSVSGPGTLEAAQTLEVKPEVNGVVLQLPKVGEWVQKGQLIARLDPTDYQRTLENAQLALQKAQANLEALRASQASTEATGRQSVASAEVAYANASRDLQSARDDLEATQKLYDIGGTSLQSLQQAKDAYAKAQASLQTARVNLETARQSLSLKASSNAQDLKNAQLAVQQAQLEVRTAQENLAATKIYAPFSGVVAEVNGQVGSVGVGATNSNSSALLTLIDISSVNLPVQVDESEISKVQVGQKVEVTLDAFSDETFQGVVTNISPQATVVSNIAVFYVTVNIPNPQHKLKPGMTAEGEILIQEIPDALVIPKRAVQTVRGRSYVEVLQPDGTQETVRVVLGPDDGVSQVITEGLEPGQQVVLPTRSSSGSSSSSQQRQGGGIGLPVRIPAGGGR
ncbi:efflux RND transporter periplasmic adaptor subunit [Calidithermus roseus]|uniref:Macrolide export protein MacA n=1 Tax=Calidithermus roseus TaxID=1644118 RepID=A0A399ETX3_9DEIN|nr:efflux RND transporter periplasmic adaptor subunit [Calidithermus roseus]RIH87033.1 Macrolide export protein MacA [Calidithermus roseus]